MPIIAIMSYNRGEYLKNCISSIQRNCPEAKIRIYDDDSDDPDTRRYLNTLRETYPVYINSELPQGDSFKGLHINMNKALEDAIAEGGEYVFFFQDDIQMVRKCDDAFLQECERIFDSDKNIVQISPVFFKSGIGSEEVALFSQDRLGTCYYFSDKKLWGMSDLGIVKVSTLKKAKWHWDTRPGDMTNARRAADLGWKFVLSKNPICMYTPWPETFRFGNSASNLFWRKLADRFYSVGVHPYKDMSESNLKKLLSRPIADFPFAETYLETVEHGLKKPWEYKDAYLVARYALARKLKKFGLYGLIKQIARAGRH